MFGHELDRLAAELPLRVVRLTGGPGGRRLDGDLLREVFGGHPPLRDVLVCGSPAFTRAAIGAAVGAAVGVGIARDRVHVDAIA